MNKTEAIPHHRFPAADGVRGLAVLIVIIAHALVMFLPNTRPYLGGTGKIGVWLFFVLSSFLLTSKFIKSGLGLRPIVEYAIGRTIRILPIFIIACIFYFLVGYYDSATLFRVVSFQEGYGHLWTIPVEFKFYFLLPVALLLYRFFYKLKGYGTVVLVSIILIVIAQIMYPSKDLPENSIYTKWYVSSFVVGILLAYSVACTKKTVNNIARLSGVFMIMSLLCIVLIIPSASEYILGCVIISDLGTSCLSISFFWGVFVFMSCFNKGYLNAALSSRVLRGVGKHSFSTYLFHWFVLTEMSNRFTGSVSAMIISIPLSLIIGWIVYYTTEKKIESSRHLIQKHIIKATN